MKRYKTTKKHPELKKGLITNENNDFILHNLNLYELNNNDIAEQLEKGWIKEVKDKVWLIDFKDNWKLKKQEKDCVGKEFFDKWAFKSKKTALEYVLEEAKERFKNGFIRPKLENSIHKCNRFEFTKKWISDISLISNIDNNCGVWKSDIGWIAESIKEKSYPKTIDELMEFAPDIHYYISNTGTACDSDEEIYFKHKNACITKKTSESILALTELIKFRDIWWQIDEWQPYWTDDKQIKYIIESRDGKTNLSSSIFTSFPLSFKSEELAKDFYKTFKKQIETAIELL